MTSIKKTYNKSDSDSGRYYKWTDQICKIATEIEGLTGTKEVLTSNKFWEILVALILGHKVLSEQSGHDAKDELGRYYEYKVAKTYSWNFQDISKKVLNKYKDDNKIVLAIVDKDDFKIVKIFEADPLKTIRTLKRKLRNKKLKFKQQGKKLRRLQVSLSGKDIKKIRAKLVYES